MNRYESQYTAVMAWSDYQNFSMLYNILTIFRDRLMLQAWADLKNHMIRIEVSYGFFLDHRWPTVFKCTWKTNSQ